MSSNCKIIISNDNCKRVSSLLGFKVKQIYGSLT